jgi:hypothetical protein
VVLVVGQLAATATAGAVPTATQRTAQGIAVELPAEREAALLDQQGAFAPPETAERGHAFRLYGRNGADYIVYTNREAVGGQAVVTGTVVEVPEQPFDVIYADSVGVSTRGRNVSVTALTENTSAYTRDLVRVRGGYRQRSTLTLSGSRTGQRVRGVLAAPSDSVPTSLSLPGRLGRRAVRGGSGDGSDAGRVLPEGTEDGLDIRAVGGPRWWMTANATVDLAVVPTRSGNGPSVRLVSVSISGRHLDSAAELARESGPSTGRVATVTGYLSATSTSVSAALAADRDCQPATATADYPVCEGARHDVRVLAGVLADEDGRDDTVVPVIGISNRNDWAGQRPVTGLYRVTGRVVNASRVDPTIPWERALLVYRLERPAAAGPVGLDRRERRQTVVDAVRQQLVTDEANWSDTRGRQTPEPEGISANRTVSATGPVIGWGPVGPYATDWGGIRIAAMGLAALVGGLLATTGRSFAVRRGTDVATSRRLELAAWAVGLVLLAVAAVVGTPNVTRVAMITGTIALGVGGLAVALLISGSDG